MNIVDILKSQGLTLSSAESLTGGLFASSIVSLPGASKVFKGGIVTYWTQVKEDVLKVDTSIIEKYGVVSKECALSMVEACRKMFSTDIAISFTGNAGPDVMENKESGLVYIGVFYKDSSYAYEYHFKGARNEVRQKCVEEGINKILEFLNK